MIVAFRAAFGNKERRAIIARTRPPQPSSLSSPHAGPPLSRLAPLTAATPLDRAGLIASLIDRAQAVYPRPTGRQPSVQKAVYWLAWARAGVQRPGGIVFCHLENRMLSTDSRHPGP